MPAPTAQAQGKSTKTKASRPLKLNEMDKYKSELPPGGPDTDLKGFKQTIANDPRPGSSDPSAAKAGLKGPVTRLTPGKMQVASPIFNEEYFESFDVCIAFPKSFKPKKENKVVSAAQVQKIIMNCLCARESNALNLNDPSSLHKAYQLSAKDVQRSYTWGELRNLFMNQAEKIINRVGCYTVKSQSKDGKFTIVRCKLEEESAKRRADATNYPMQMDYNVTSFDQFKQDPSFSAPFVPYERCIERTTRDGSAMDKIGHVWQRYDRISRPYNHQDVERGSTELSIFRDIDRVRLLSDSLNEYMNLTILEDKGFLNAYPLHQPAQLQALKSSWGTFRLCWTTAQPLDQICAYFGEKLALYYAWLQLYCWMLVIPSVTGLGLYSMELLFDYNMNYTQGWLNYFRVFYCAVVASWASWFFQLWQRKESQLCIRWGSEVVTGNKATPTKSPWFKPTTAIADPIHPTGKSVQTVPAHHRFMRKAIATTVVVTLTICAAMAVNDEAVNAFLRMMGILGSSAPVMTWESLIEKGEASAGVTAVAKSGTKAFWFVAFLPLVLLVKIVSFLWDRVIIQRVAQFENNPYFEQYYRSVTLYSFVFKFTNHLIPLMYLAFLKEYFGDLCQDMDDGRCIKATRKMLQGFFTAGLTGNIFEIGIPFLKQFLGTRSAKKKAQGASIPFFEQQLYTKMYNTRAQIKDFQEVMLEFCFVALFGVIFPLMPLLNLLVTMVEVRSDAYKLTHVYRRTWPDPAPDGVGSWNTIQRCITFACVVTNVLLCGLVTIGYHRSLVFKLTFSLLLLLLTLAFKEFLEYRFPITSKKYRTQKARAHVVHFEAIWGTKHMEAKATPIGF